MKKSEDHQIEIIDDKVICLDCSSYAPIECPQKCEKCENGYLHCVFHDTIIVEEGGFRTVEERTLWDVWCDSCDYKTVYQDIITY